MSLTRAFLLSSPHPQGSFGGFSFAVYYTCSWYRCPLEFCKYFQSSLLLLCLGKQ